MKPILLLSAIALIACEKSTKADNSPTMPASSASVAAAPGAPALAAPAVPASSKTNSSKTTSLAGTFQAVLRKSTTGKKEGAPSGWEKDDGKRFTGAGSVQLSIAPDGTVTGTLKGALGEPRLSGRLEGDELRAALLPSGTDVTQIQNGVLSLKREGDSWKGQLSCASGDALLLREAQLELKPSAG